MAKIGYFKTFGLEDKTFQPFTAHKQWTVSNGDGLSSTVEITGSYYTGSKVYLATHSTASLNGFISASTDEPAYNSKYRFILHSQINRMFYQYALGYSAENLGLATPLQMSLEPRPNKRILHRSAVVASIPHEIVGEGIRPESVTIVDKNGSTIELEDDGHTNLIDKSITTASLSDDDELVVYVPFNEGYKYIGSNKVNNYIGRYHGQKPGLQYNSPFPHNISAYNVSFEEGMHGHSLKLKGISSSFAIIDRQGNMGSDMATNREFSIAFWLKCPVSQSVSHSFAASSYELLESWPQPGFQFQIKRRKKILNTENVILSRRQSLDSGAPFPFEISIVNSWHYDSLNPTTNYHGRLRFKRSDGSQVKTMEYSASINDDAWRHFSFRKVGSWLEMHCNGLMVKAIPDFPWEHDKTVHNDAPIVIGGVRDESLYDYGSDRGNTFWRSSAYKPIEYVSSTQTIKDYSTEPLAKPFKGSIDELRIYNGALPSASIMNLSSSVSNTNIVGNVFYDYGLVTITDPRPKYQQMFQGTGANGWYINFQNNHTIYEHEYYCHINSNDFRLSMNPTLRNTNATSDSSLKGFSSSSTFSPYITTIGLYNDDLELLAVAKTAQPMRKPDNMDTTIIVRFDR